MKEIDKYLKLLYKHLNATEEEIAALRAEMEAHLIETVHELQAEGKTPQESVQIAIERFGDAEMLRRQLPDVLMVSRRRFSRVLFAAAGVVLVLIIGVSLISFDNVKKGEKLKTTEESRKAFVQELQKVRADNQNYIGILQQMAELTAAYSEDTAHWNQDLEAKYNKPAIERIAKMNETFHYHNGVLTAIAVIASETGYECPFFDEIAQLAVMKLSDSMEVINLAEKAREAKTEKEQEAVKEMIQQMKDGAEFKTYQEALDYNKKF